MWSSRLTPQRSHADTLRRFTMSSLFWFNLRIAGPYRCPLVAARVRCCRYVSFIDINTFWSNSLRVKPAKLKSNKRVSFFFFGGGFSMDHLSFIFISSVWHPIADLLLCWGVVKHSIIHSFIGCFTYILTHTHIHTHTRFVCVVVCKKKLANYSDICFHLFCSCFGFLGLLFDY